MDSESFLINQLSSKHIGDDGAVIGNMVYSVDAFYENIHFKREWMSLEQIAQKAMLVNISDAIAMNATPKYALVSISIPKDISREDILILTTSLEESANKFGCEIIGGDTVGGDKLDISITIISKSDNPLYRKGLKSGDLLAFTGHLGDSKRDLDRLFNGEKIDKNSRFFIPTLRDEFIYKSRKFLSVGMDISDGLYCDTNKLLEYNNLGFDILIDINDDIGDSGEEYEMLIGFNKVNLDNILKISADTNTPITVFAEVVDNNRRFNCKSHHFDLEII
ncbi:Thiamine-monophosphate kinase [hydrothermal vent metagenome]|uniref:Thiamine-monophosphate kinase n=1 Tax=hydrothermal vent metagenome TaxID=652676 RepID=A0A1W1BT85_9ZZZZ